MPEQGKTAPEISPERLQALVNVFNRMWNKNLPLQDIISQILWYNEHCNLEGCGPTPELFDAKFLYDCGITALD